MRLALVTLFGVAMAYIEAAIVVYLRRLYYPEGFAFPLQAPVPEILAVEAVRELATLVMVVTVAGLAGRRFWERFGYFLTLFGVWDTFYYVWLKVAIGWPSWILDWDVLFLIPLPWIGPVVAPVLIASMMVVFGILITRWYARGYTFRPGFVAAAIATVATALILYSFINDLDAALHQQMPRSYRYDLLVLGLAGYVVAFLACRRGPQVGSAQ